MENQRGLESIGPDGRNQVTEDNITTEKEALDKVVDMYTKALDDLVNVNSLFTMAVFIGLSFATPNQRSLEDRRQCDPDGRVGKNLVMYEVLSFSLFLVSSLAAKSLKVLLSIHKLRKEFNVKFKATIELPFVREMFTSKPWRKTVFLISSAASSLGVFFLTLSMVNVIQIRLGKLSCDSANTFKSVISLSVLVFFALMLYLPPMLYAALANFDESNKDDIKANFEKGNKDDIIKANFEKDNKVKAVTPSEVIKAMAGVL